MLVLVLNGVLRGAELFECEDCVVEENEATWLLPTVKYSRRSLVRGCVGDLVLISSPST